MAALPEEEYVGGEQQHGMYHVPQHCRREKLRYPPSHDPPPGPPPTSQLLLHDPPLGFPNLTTSFQNPSYSTLPSSFQFAGPASSHGDFSLSLCSSSSTSSHGQYSGRGTATFGPFRGYAAVLGGSGYLEPARRLLEETCAVARGDGAIFCWDPAASLSVEDVTAGCVGIVNGGVSSGTEQQYWRKTRLISMLEEVCRRFMVYYEQIQAAMTVFESVAGLSMSAPYATLSLQKMAKHFSCLRNAISDQLHQIGKVLEKECLMKEEIPGSMLTSDGVLYNNQRAGNNHVWRPQRGLPERAVAVLRAWLFDHFLHPYPTDTDKQMLAKQTGLSRNQVSNWFINARVRLWKPMVEEIHSLEMQKLRKTSGKPNHPIKTASSSKSSDNSNLWVNRNTQQQPPKPFRDEITKASNHIEEPLSFPLDGHIISNSNQAETARLLNGDVSLSLGLHQNSGFSLSDRIAQNVVACHFGIDECNDAYAMGALDVQDHHYRRTFGGHFVHDFGG